VISEFLPEVPWAGKYNTISCAAAFHFYEGRWLHDQNFLDDYARFWFRGSGNPRLYSFWVADALYNRFLVTGDTTLIKDLLPDLISNYEGWEKEKLDQTGLFWQIDDRDGMEMSVCGNGYRATINSYMYGDASAISKMASILGDNELSEIFTRRSNTVKDLILSRLWDSTAGFFKVLPRKPDSKLCDTRELHGYTPWYFNIPGNEYSIAWKYIMDPVYFYAPYGPTTTEQNSREFKISYEGHECQWNGPSWPYATSITLTALANLLNNYSQDYISRNDYFNLLTIYSNSHQLKQEDGKTVPWIDENLDPFTGDWISRSRLRKWKNGTWSTDKGGVEIFILQNQEATPSHSH
jgi:glycogen debranching enzyme